MSVDWRHVPARFEAFLAWLQPTPEERRRASAGVKAVADVVRCCLQADGDRLKASIADPLVVGGFGKGTAIRDGDAVDALLILPPHSRESRREPGRGAKAGRRAADTPAGLAVARELASQFASSAGCASSPMQTKLVPAFACRAGGYLVADRNRTLGGGPWRLMQPRLEVRHLDHADAISGGKARHLIQMAKAWRRTSAAPIAPFAIELLVCEFLSAWLYRRRGFLFYDWLVRDFFFWLTAQIGVELPIPGGGETLNTGTGWRRHAERAYRLAALAADLERDNRSSESLFCWSLVFGGEFLLARQQQMQGLPAVVCSGGSR
ncbi:MAG: hypothetical protein P9C48_08135 [Defluviicoccus sp.]|nr:hypothetical protein [Defluviicoccus sp.]MDG4609083.1 hypothetical protein [Defluviicoccus sp.]